MRTAYIALLAIALFGGVVMCSEDEMPDYGGDDDYGGGEDDYGGGVGGDEDAPPPDSSSLRELTTVEEFDAFLDDNDASVVGALLAKEITDPEASQPPDWDADEDGEWAAPVIEHPTLKSLSSLSSSVYGYRYAYTTAPEVLEKLKSKAGGLYLFKSPRFVSKEHGDRPRERFPSDTLTENAVSNWLSSKAQPLVGMYSSSTKDRYKGPVLVIFMNLDFDANSKGVTYVLKRARKAAVALKGKLSIAVASVSDMSYELSDFGLTSKSEKSDMLMGISAGGQYYGAAEGTAFSAKALTAFADAFLAGELTPYEKPPYEPPAGDDGEGESEANYDDDVGDD